MAKTKLIRSNRVYDSSYRGLLFLNPEISCLVEIASFKSFYGITRDLHNMGISLAWRLLKKSCHTNLIAPFFFSSACRKFINTFDPL